MISLLNNPLISQSFKGLPPYDEWLDGIYDYIVKDYLSDIYIGIIEEYVISTIRVSC